METRPMDFAGIWYPTEGPTCRKKLQALTGEADGPPRRSKIRLGVAPHAGWTYSGAVAASVYGAMDDGEDVPLVVVLGGHLGREHPILAMCEGAWETPLGSFSIHQGFRPALDRFSNILFETPFEYHKDNSTELQLPFAKFRFPNAELLPIRVPPSDVALELGRVLGEYLAEHAPGAVVIASTDLTHYGPGYGFQPQGVGERALRWVREVNDPGFIMAVKEGSGREMIEVAQRCHSACSAGAVAALNEVATQQRVRFKQTNYATSADAGPRDKENFVGYLGGVFG